jgi:hypothetical protein
MIDVERLDLESASSAYRRRRCSGSVNLINELRASGKLKILPPDPDAQSGTRMHEAWCDSRRNGLLPREADTVASLQRMEETLVAQWAGRDQYVLLGREQRLWLHQGFEPIHSGQFDVAYGTLSTQRMLILDGKTLFGEVSPAETNDQLRELVALAHLNYPQAQEFTVAILQPWISSLPSVAVYDRAEAELSLRLLRQTIADCADPDAPRTPGAWCRHCPAIHHCEEARTLVGSTYRLAKRIEAGEYALPVGEQGARFLDSVKTAETILEALKAAYREILLADPHALPGWYMKEGKRVREISNVLKAWDVAAPHMSLEAFMAATKLSVTALEKAFGQTTEAFNSAFESVLSFKQNAPELTRESVRKGRHKALPLQNLSLQTQTQNQENTKTSNQ